VRPALTTNITSTKAINKRPKPKKRNACANTQQQKIKWATFTYSGKEVRKITKLFRDTNKNCIPYKNAIENILKPQPQIDKYSRIGIYQMKCLDCPLKYIGQTGRTFNIRYREHIQVIRNNNNNSGYSNHILNTGHTYGTINDTNITAPSFFLIIHIKLSRWITEIEIEISISLDNCFHGDIGRVQQLRRLRQRI
jgi:hypothetical protein